MADDGKTTEGRQVPWRLIAVVVAVVLLLWFGLANRQHVSVHFWVTTRRVRLSFALLVAALLGAAIGFFGARARYRGH